MDKNKIRTSYDLADYLETTAHALRMLPCVVLDELKSPIRRPQESSKPHKNQRTADLIKNQNFIAANLANMNKDDAREMLNRLSVDSIRQLAPTIGIRIPSKGTKTEYVDLLVSQLFDAPRGQELIRTFHERQRLLSDSGLKVSSMETQVSGRAEPQRKMETYPKREKPLGIP